MKRGTESITRPTKREGDRGQHAGKGRQESGPPREGAGINRFSHNEQKGGGRTVVGEAFPPLLSPPPLSSMHAASTSPAKHDDSNRVHTPLAAASAATVGFARRFGTHAEAFCTPGFVLGQLLGCKEGRTGRH